MATGSPILSAWVPRVWSTPTATRAGRAAPTDWDRCRPRTSAAATPISARRRAGPTRRRRAPSSPIPRPATTTSSPSARPGSMRRWGRTPRPTAASRSARCIWRWPISGRSSIPWGVLRQDALQRAAVHLETPRGFRDVALAQLEDALDMLPAHPVGRHRVLGGFRRLALAREQRALDRVGIGRFRQVIERPGFDRSDRGRDVAIAGEDDDARARPALAQGADDVEAATVAETQIDD